MAAETEGIALLSMYGDDEDDEDAAAAAAAAKEDEVGATAPAKDDGEYNDVVVKDNHNKIEHLPEPVTDKFLHSFSSPSPLHSLDGAELKTLRSPFPHQTPTSQPPVPRSQLSSPVSLTSPSPPPVPAPASAMQEYQGQRVRSALAIVDYAQDETAMSPDAEVMNIDTYGREVLVSEGSLEGATPMSSQSLTQSEQELAPPIDAQEQSKFEVSMVVDFTGTESEVAEIKASSTISTYMEIDMSMQNFLPPTVSTKCSELLQEKINKFLVYKRAGKSFNADLRNRKDYRNPNFLQHAVSYQEIDEIGTCFNKEVFDPHGFDKSDYYDEIEADLKRELERKEQERKKSPKIDFVSGCAQQPGGLPPTVKTNAHIPPAGVSSLLNSSLLPNFTTGDAARDSRTNKKSKWDKVDGDAKIPLPSGGNDNPPTTTNVHASHLSAANAGTGYSAFAQLKRKEAEEKKSSERKFDKRS